MQHQPPDHRSCAFPLSGGSGLRLCLAGLLIWASCTTPPVKNPSEKHAAQSLELMRVDREFSEASSRNGMKMAFLQYLDSNGVLLRPSRMPITGAESIDYLVSHDDSDFSMSWDPHHAEVSASGELGFTYGVYAMKPREQDTLLYGTYTHVWKRQSDSTWKLLLDSENAGISD